MECDENGSQKNGFEGYQLLANKKHVMITELTTPSQSPSEESEEMTESNKRERDEKKENDESKFFVEEPFDFIFEPDHYPKPHGNAEKKAKLDNDVEPKEPDNNNQHRYAQVVRELDDGMLEYEYKSFTYDRSFYTNKLNDDLDSIYFAGFNSQQHIRAESLIRGISLSRWPRVGFGFELGVASLGGDRLVYVNRIHADSPAELSSLRLGDVIIEIDEILPAEGFHNGQDDPSDEALLKRVDEYVAGRENLHLMVVSHSQYARLKADNNDDLLKNYYFNCEDIVVVNFRKQNGTTHVDYSIE